MGRRRTSPSKISRPESISARGVRSVSGHHQSGGAVSEDINPALQGQGWVSTVQKMRRDGRLYGAWRALKQTLLSASMKWAPPPGSGELAQEAASWLNEMFGFDGNAGTMRRPFERQLESMLEFIPLGWRYAEVDYQRQPDGAWGIAEFLDCQPSAHHQWLPLDGRGPLEGIRQLDPSGSFGLNSEDVPASKLLLLTLNQEGDNPEGFGLFRPCWFAWNLKQFTFDQMGIGVERSASGIPTAELDRAELSERQRFEDAEIDGVPTDDSLSIKEQVEEAIANVVAGAEAQIVTYKGVSFSMIFNDAFKPERLRAVVDLANEEMLTVFLNAFLMLGLSSSGGSYSLGETHKDLFSETALNLLQQVVQTITGPAGPGTGPVGRILDWHPRFNRLPHGERPTIEITGLDTASFLAFLQTLPALGAAGFATPHDALERWILRKGGAPDLPDGMGRPPEERLAKDSISAALMRGQRQP